MRYLLRVIAFFAGFLLLVASVQAGMKEAELAYNSKDYKTAFAEYESLAKQGNAEAQFRLGLMYGGGQGTTANESQAVMWYQEAAEQGLAKAQTVLGIRYMNGTRVVPRNYAQGRAWLQKAADQGDAMAQYNLGVIYAEGKGVPKDNQKAVVWYKKAAEQDMADAQANLGAQYIFGFEGMPNDFIQAHMWISLAARSGQAHHKKMLSLLEPMMKPEDIEKAKALAKDWKPITVQANKT